MGAIQYQVGGSLQSQAPSYITRTADQALYQALLKGEFCYVLNSRQMGKSSLLVQTRDRLTQAGYRCATLDLTNIGSDNITPLQWYKGIVKDLWRGFKLMRQVPINDWWKDEADISLLQRLSYFIGDVLLQQFPDQDIVIFIDEVDSILSLPFSADDFFALIRFCYNQRATNPDYNRIRFAIFGVAAPADLIRDRSRTPFNLGTAIELQGFTADEALPLAEGLEVQGGDPTAILKAIIHWTGGQPFLTQKLCKLAIDEGVNGQLIVMPGNERYWVEQLVQTAVLGEWESQDEPEHLRTIRNRLLSHPETVGRLLAVYQQVLTGQAVASNDSSEQVELLLSGLVVKQDGHLQVRNPIYERVFNSAWVEQQLSELRPYAQALEVWQASGQADESRLLRGQALKDAQIWSQGKRLSDEDYRFLAASVESDRQAMHQAAEAKQVLAQLEQEQKAARLQRQFSGALTGAFLIAVGFGALTFWQYRQSQISEISAIATAAEGHFESHHQLKALQEIVMAQSKLQRLARPPKKLTRQVQAALQRTLDGSHAMNQIRFDTEIQSLSIHPNGELLAVVTSAGKLSFWRPNGERAVVAPQLSEQIDVSKALFSPDGKHLALAQRNSQIQIWSLNGQKLQDFEQPKRFNHWFFSADGQSLLLQASGSLQQVDWATDDRTTLPAEHRLGTSTISVDGSLIAAAYQLQAPGASRPGLVPSPGQSRPRSLGFSGSPPAGPPGRGPRGSGPPGGPMGHAARGGRRNLQLWDDARNPVGTLATIGGPIFAVAVSPNNQLIATAHVDGEIRLTRPNGELQQELFGLQVKVNRLAFSPDGQMLAAGDVDGGIHLWNVGGSLIKSLLGHRGKLSALQFSPDGRWLASTSQDSSLRIWKTDHSLHHVLAGHTDVITGLYYSPDGQQLHSLGVDQRMQVWQRNNEGDFAAKPAQSLDLAVGGAVSLSRDRQTMARGIPQQGGVISTAEGQESVLLEGVASGGLGREISLAISPGGERLAAPGHSGELAIWQKPPAGGWSPDPQQILQVGNGGLTSLSWSAQGEALVTGHRSGNVTLWTDVSAGMAIALGEGEAHAAAVTTVAVSPNNRWIASGSTDKTIKIWNRAGKLVQTLIGHEARVRRVAFSPDSSKLASISSDATLKLWQVGKLPAQESPLLRSLRQHQGEVNGLAFSPDGLEIATAGSDRKVIVWQIQDILALDELAYACEQVSDYLKYGSLVEDEARSLCDAP